MKRRGSILMEFVIVAPLVLILVSFILQFAHIWIARQVTAYAAYCATRAILAVPPAEQEAAAKKAAEMACSWMSIVGLPGAVVAARSRPHTETRIVDVGRLHGDTTIPAEEEIYYDRNNPVVGEVGIPGWGSIPGSDSAGVRVDAEVVEGGVGRPIAEVTVRFKFPLVLPLAGRMTSWWVNRPGEKFDSLEYGHHVLSDAGSGEDSGGGEEEESVLSRKGWSGQEVVMDESGNAVARNDGSDKVVHGHDGRYPFIVLTETCVLPMPYSTARFPAFGYKRDDGGDARVSDLTRGEDL